MNIRYSLLPYTYTLFHKAHEAGETVLRALAWEFPNDAQLAGVETQFMSGPALLITPVLAPLATSVQGVFPGVAEGTRWYDWYTLEQVDAAAGENKTLEAPLLHQPIHIRGGYIVPIQKAGNTTKTSRLNPWSLIIALDKDGKAEGDLYLDDGINIVQGATKEVHVSSPCASAYESEGFGDLELTHSWQLTFANNTLHATVSGDFNDDLPLANITIAGATKKPSSVSVNGGRADDHKGGHKGGHSSGNATESVRFEKNVLYLTDLESATQGGVWKKDLEVRLW